MNINKEQISKAIKEIQDMLNNKNYPMYKIESIYSIICENMKNAEDQYYNLPRKHQLNVKGVHLHHEVIALYNASECIEVIEFNDSVIYKRAMLKDTIEYLKDI